MKFIFSVIVPFLILALHVSVSLAKVDCRKVVFHPSCRGITAKRSNLQGSSANIIEHMDTSNKHRRRLVDHIVEDNYSGLEKEDTPDLEDRSPYYHSQIPPQHMTFHMGRRTPSAPLPPRPMGPRFTSQHHTSFRRVNHIDRAYMRHFP